MKKKEILSKGNETESCLLCRHGRRSFKLMSFSTAFVGYAKKNRPPSNKTKTKTDEIKESFVKLCGRSQCLQNNRPYSKLGSLCFLQEIRFLSREWVTLFLIYVTKHGSR